MVYLDDVTIFSETKGEYIENVFTVVRKLQKRAQEGPVLNEGKCEWGRSSILYLGHVTRILKRLQRYYSGYLARQLGARFLEYHGILPTVCPRVCKGGEPALLEGSPRKGSPGRRI